MSSFPIMSSFPHSIRGFSPKANVMRTPVLAALAFMVLGTSLTSCSEDDPDAARLNVEVVYDPSQVRLDNLGNPSPVATGNAGQTPMVRDFRINSIELAPTAFTLPGQGVMLYQAPETNAGGATAIHFDEMIAITDGSFDADITLSDIPPGTYPYLRVSVAYQNGDVLFSLRNTPLGDLENQTGSISSFLGYNTYITTVTPNTLPVVVNDDKLQGFWAFETSFDPPYDAFNSVSSGQAPAGATTVVNPLAATAAIPPGSCIVTGAFEEPFVVSGDESSDRSMTLSFSVDRSFEWVDDNGNGQWDFDFAAGTVEPLVDMGLRGLIGRWE
jgi:hypothetical protein